MPFFSIIIPYFNAEKFIKNCLMSIMGQSFKDFEVILINDASTDNSLSICKEVIKDDTRFILIENEENIGPGPSRNKGLEIAKGKYILFIDADDYIMPATLKKLHDIIETCDVDMINFATAMEQTGQYGGKYPCYFEEKVYEGKDKEDMLLSILKAYRTDLLSVNLHCFKRELINDIIFGDMLLYEGLLFALKALLKAKKVYQCNDNLYVKNVHLATITRKYNVHISNNLTKTAKEILSIIENCKEHKTSFSFADNLINTLVKVFVESEIFSFGFIGNGIFREYMNCADVDDTRKNVKAMLDDENIQKILELSKNYDIDKNILLLIEKGIEKDESYMYNYLLDYFHNRSKKTIEKYGMACPVEYCVNKKKKLIYMVNAKVACSSLKSSLSDYEFTDDYSVHMLSRRIDIESKNTLSDEEKEYFIFSFVRNPLRRIVSCYENKMKTDRRKGFNQFVTFYHGIISRDEGFDKFIRNICSVPLEHDDRHFMSQYMLLHDRDGKLIPNFVGKFENLDDDYEKVRSKFDLKPIQHLNPTDKRDKKDWRSYFTLETAEMFHKKYIKDFETFGYEDDYKELINYLTKS